MTKQDILDYFSLIDFAYNESGRLESLSRMIDELLTEHEAQKFFVDESGKITPLPVVVRCKDCGNKECWGRAGDVVCGIDGTPHRPDWFCADGERK